MADPNPNPSWFDRVGTGLGDLLIAPQTFGSLMPAPTDPQQRQAMIWPALLSLGTNMMQAGRQGIGPLEAFGSAYQGLQQQGAQRGQQQLQSALLMGKIGEAQKRNQTMEMLSKTKPPEGWSDEAWKAFVASDTGEAFKVYAASIKDARDRAAIGGMGDFPGMGPGGGGGTSYDARVRGVESPDGRDNMKGSGATGYYQFMPSTAHSLAQQTQWGRGLTPDQVTAAIREEVQSLPRGQVGPKQQELKRLYDGIGERALQGSGLPVNDATRYAVHWFGAAGGPSLLRAPADMPIGEWAKTVKWDNGASPDSVIAQNDLAKYGTVGGVRAEIARRMGGMQPAPMPQPPMPTAQGTPAPMPQPSMPNAAGPNATSAPMPSGVQPVQFTPGQQQGAPQADYRNDPVIQEAYQAFRAARTPEAALAARQRAAARIAELQQQAQANINRKITVGPDGRPQVNEALVDAEGRIQARQGEEAARIATQSKAGGVLAEKAATQFMDLREKAMSAASEIDAIHTGRQVLDAGAFTGLGANQKTALGRAGELLGFKSDEAINSQVFGAAMATRVFALVKNLGSGTGISEGDRKFANQAAAGEITLDEAAIRRLLDIGERTARGIITKFNKEGEGWKKTPGVPSLPDSTYGIPAPMSFQDWAKANPLTPMQRGPSSVAPSAPAAAPSYRWDGKKLVPVQ